MSVIPSPLALNVSPNRYVIPSPGQSYSEPLQVYFSSVYLENAQYTGTSGLTIEDQTTVMENALQGNIAPVVCVAAIGGMKVAKSGIEAMMDSRFPGKIIIFPQLEDLPLMRLDELAEKLPEVSKKLGAGNTWTVEAEKAIFEAFIREST